MEAKIVVPLTEAQETIINALKALKIKFELHSFRSKFDDVYISLSPRKQYRISADGEVSPTG